MHIALITAGGAGMFCGSCMHDNTWAHGLRDAGAEVSLIPTYTPIRVDEEDLSIEPVFLGGINVYMEYRSRLWQRIPRRLTRLLDTPRILNLASQIGISSDARQLGALTLALLHGESGPHWREVDELAQYVTDHLKPDVVCFSNALLVGALRRLRERFNGPIFCTLQGDDIFLEALPEPERSRALAMITERLGDFDGFLVHSRYYRDFMADYFHLPADRFAQIPLGIDLAGHNGRPQREKNDVFTVGYFARICPQKGLNELVDAFRLLHSRRPETRLRVGGYLGKQDRAYYRRVLKKTRSFSEAYEYIGSPATREDKIAFLQALDVLSVPTVYREPKGLYVLEALANGVPVVQPDHGAFGELTRATGGGLLVKPGDRDDLAAALERLMDDAEQRMQLAANGRERVHSQFDPATMAQASLRIFEHSLAQSSVPRESRDLLGKT